MLENEGESWAWHMNFPGSRKRRVHIMWNKDEVAKTGRTQKSGEGKGCTENT